LETRRGRAKAREKEYLCERKISEGEKIKEFRRAIDLENVSIENGRDDVGKRGSAMQDKWR
jgi:hypothetical protein